MYLPQQKLDQAGIVRACRHVQCAVADLVLGSGGCAGCQQRPHIIAPALRSKCALHQHHMTAQHVLIQHRVLVLAKLRPGATRCGH